MPMTPPILIPGTAIFVIIAVWGAWQAAAKFSELQRLDIPGTGREGVTTLARFRLARDTIALAGFPSRKTGVLAISEFYRSPASFNMARN